MKIQFRGKKHYTAYEFIQRVGMVIFNRSRYRKLSFLFRYAYSKHFHKSTVTNNILHPNGVSFYFTSVRSFDRAIHAHNKEPMTLQWIRSMKPGEVLWDIGSNVGVFTLLASKCGLRVVAFEPLYSNYHDLCKSIEKDSASMANVIALPLALSKKDGVDNFFVPESDAGSSGASFGIAEDEKGQPLKYLHEVNLLGMTGQSVQKLLPGFFATPNHIKIDVDGTEMEILMGLDDLLSEPTLNSILVEIDEGYVGKSYKIIHFLSIKGFVNSVEEREPTVFSRVTTCKNYIFRRY